MIFKGKLQAKQPPNAPDGEAYEAAETTDEEDGENTDQQAAETAESNIIARAIHTPY